MSASAQMNLIKDGGLLCLLAVGLLPNVANAQFTYTTSDDGVTITGHTGADAVVKIPSTIQNLPVTAIGQYAFYYNTNIVSVTIPDSVTSIGDSAFLNCPRLTTARIGASVASIGPAAFCNTRLHRVNLPATVTNIAEGAFDGCGKLNSLNVDPANEHYTGFKGVLFNKAGDMLIKFPAGKSGRYTIPTNTMIAPDAFTGCNLNSITIPSSVATIPDNAFYGCLKLKAITIPASVTSIGYDAFGGCANLRSVTIPGSVTNIGTGAFSACTALKDVEIMEGVLSVGDYAFADTHLLSVTMPATLTSIGSESFGSDYGLVAVYFKGDAPTLGAYAFDGANVTLYHLANTAGWDSFYSQDHPVQVWTP